MQEDTREELAALKLTIALQEQKINQMEEKINNLNSGINRGLWVIGGGFVASAVAWIVNGGLMR